MGGGGQWVPRSRLAKNSLRGRYGRPSQRPTGDTSQFVFIHFSWAISPASSSSVLGFLWFSRARVDRRQKVWNGLKEGFGRRVNSPFGPRASSGGLRQQLRNITAVKYDLPGQRRYCNLYAWPNACTNVLQCNTLLAIQFQSNYKSGGWGGGQIWAEGGGDHKCWVSASCSFLCNWFICRYPIAVHLSLRSRRGCLQVIQNCSFLVMIQNMFNAHCSFFTAISLISLPVLIPTTIDDENNHYHYSHLLHHHYLWQVDHKSAVIRVLLPLDWPRSRTPSTFAVIIIIVGITIIIIIRPTSSFCGNFEGSLVRMILPWSPPKPNQHH